MAQGCSRCRVPVVLGRAAWPRGVPGAGCLSFWAGLLGVPVGGGPPASRPRCELRSARRLVVRPGLGLLHVAQFWLSIINFACNSPAACSNIEFASLELQRFLGLLKFGPIELHAKFVWLWSCDRPPAPWRVPAARGPPAPSEPSAPSGPFRSPGPTSALRTSGAWCAVVACRDSASRSVQNSPCLVFC